MNGRSQSYAKSLSPHVCYQRSSNYPFWRGIKQVGNAFVISRDFFILEVHCSGWCQINDPRAPLHFRPRRCPSPQWRSHKRRRILLSIPSSLLSLENSRKLLPKDVILAYVFLQGGRLLQQSSVMLKTRKSTHRRLT